MFKGGDILDYNVTYRKKDKGWQCIISYKLGDKWKQKSKQGYKTQKEYKDWIDDTLEELEKIVDSFTDGFTLQMLCDKYVEDYSRSKAKRTIEILESAVNSFPTLKNKPIENISKQDVQNCINAMVHLEVGTIKTRCSVLRRLFNVAIKDYKLIKENPFERLIYPQKDTIKRKRSALTLQELNTLINSTKSLKRRVIIALAGKCGMRIGEICALTISDIDLENREIKVTQQWKKLQDGSSGYGILKNREGGARTIPISEDVTNLLKEYLPTCKFKRIIPYASSTVASTAFNRYLHSKGYPFTVHELRHTFATTLLANGTDIKTVAYLMGDTVDTIIKVYIHFTSEMMDNAKKKIKDIF